MTITKEIINDYLAGKSSALQKQMIENFLREEPNEELFYQFLIDYESRHPIFLADVDQAVSKYYQFLGTQEPSVSRPPGVQQDNAAEPTHEPMLATEVIRSHTRPIWLPYSIAATVALLLLATGWLFRNSLRYETYTTAYGQTEAVALADGSTVVLNANSTLRVPRFGFSSGKRHVHLSGEALFSVRHTVSNQPFIVNTNNGFEVEVLGTVFNVFARPRGGKVVLNQGRVNVLLTTGMPDHPHMRRKVILKPGQLVQITPKKQIKLEETSAPENHAAWRDNRYVFDKTTVAEIGNLLRDNYGLTLTTNDAELLTLTVSGSYTAANADELLQLLETTLGITAARHKNTVTLSRREARQPM